MWSPANICEQCERNLFFGSVDVSGAGTCDEPLRTSAWEATFCVQRRKTHCRSWVSLLTQARLKRVYEQAIELAAAVFINDYNSMAMSFMTKLNVWLRTGYRIISARFLLVFILIHGNDKQDRLLAQLVLNGLREATSQLTSTSLILWMPCFLTLCVWAYFWKIEEFAFPFYSRTAYNGVVYQRYLVLLFSKSQWFGMIKQFCAVNVCFPKIKTKT